MTRTRILLPVLTASLLAGAAFAQEPAEAPVTARVDARTNLGSGLFDAENAAWNVERIGSVQSPPGFFDPEAVWRLPPEPKPGEARQRPGQIMFANTDLAFSGDRVFMGNFHGFNVFEAPGDGSVNHILSVVCPGGQGDVSVYGDLVFLSQEQNRGRLDCGGGGVSGRSSEERFRGVRIFDISDIDNPRQVAAVQTCRGSHTHTLVPHPTDTNVLYVYNSATSGVRPGSELEGCSNGEPSSNPDTALYSIDIIKVMLDAPEEAAIVNRPRIFADRETGEVNGLWKGGQVADGGQKTNATNHCHDITVYPEMNLAAGACSGNGILLDISDPENPSRISELADPNMAYWHSATFNNDATKVLYADEWGGGLGARCRADDPIAWGGDIIADITEDGLVKRSQFKIPSVQPDTQNCVSHNGAIIPVPGRDIMVQGWYQGGLSVIDFTDSAHPKEIAYFDQGAIDDGTLVLAGYWAAYWHNGRIYAPEIVRGLDVFKLTPSEFLSEAEIAAAEMLTVDVTNPQWQRRIVWPDSPVIAQAYLDQLARADGVGESGLGVETVRELARWEAGRPRTKELARLAASYEEEAQGADAAHAEIMMNLASALRRAGE